MGFNEQEVVGYLEDGKRTKQDIADEFDVTTRSAYNYVQRLSEDYSIQAEKVSNKGKKAFYIDPEDVNPPGIEPFADEDSFDTSSNKLYDLLSDMKEGVSSQQLKEAYGVENPEDFIHRLREEDHEIEEEQRESETIYFIPESVQDSFKWEKEGNEYKFGIVSDTHMGSEAEQLESLHKFYKKMKDEDVELVIHAGDISDGCEVYRGHIHHKKDGTRTWGDLLDYVAENYPDEDLDTFLISGNHDKKMFNKTGIRFCKELSKRRDDIHYIGDSYANIDLGNLNIDVVHPSGGIPYSVGYRAQTWLRDRPEADKADITILGHLHQFLDAETEGSQVIYAGAFQGTTPYLERKGIKPKCGGWIIEAEFSDEVNSWVAERVQYPFEDEDEESENLLDMVNSDDRKNQAPEEG